MACRRAEKAARRGDVKTSGHWLASDERHLAITDRLNRMSISRVKQQAIVAEHPYRLTILGYRARISG